MNEPDLRGWRVQALELAIRTVASVNTFSVSQVINTANEYEKYISAGTVPPLPVPAPRESDA